MGERSGGSEAGECTRRLEETESVGPRRASAALIPGALLGRYIVLERIGAGGMGVVYAAYDPDLHRRVALKVMHVGGSDATGDQGRRARLLREAQAMARLTHPNVVTVHDVGRIDDDVFIAMELVDGLSLTDWLGAQRRGWPEVVRVFIEAGRGLQAAHDAGLVHRDFKPDNVLVSGDGRVLVTDFGIARLESAADAQRSPEQAELTQEVTQEGDTPRTRAGAVIGTPAYMSPEQHLGEPTDARSDQFSFCVSLWEGLYGQRPFRGDTFAALSLAITEGKIDPPPTDVIVPKTIRSALLRGLSVDPAQRHRSMAELLSTLQRRRSAARRWVLPTVLPIVAAGATAAALSPAAEAPCADPDSHIEDVWGGQARGELQQAWKDRGRFAADTLPHVVEALDGYRDDWVQAWHSTCEATKIRGEQSDQAFDRSMACLRTGRAELQSAVELLTEPDQDVLVRGLDIAGGLSDVQGCLDVEALGRLDPLPTDEAQLQAMQEVERLIGRSSALLDAGKWDASLQVATQAWELAQSVEYRPIQADAAFHQAVALWLMGNIDEGLQQMLHAHFVASGCGHDLRAARAAGELLYIVTEHKARYEEAELWYRHGAAALQRIGRSVDDDARLTGNLGILRQSQGRLDEAVKAYEQALEVHLRESGEQSIAASNTINDLALVYEIQGQYDKALAFHERALAIREHLGGPRHPEVAASHNNIGLVLRSMGNAIEAKRHFEQALEINTEVFGPDNIALASSLNNLGATLDILDQLEEARAAYQRALELRTKHLPEGHPDIASVYKNLGLNAAARDQYEEAKGYLERALASLEQRLGPDHPYVGEAVYRLGELECRAGRCQDGEAQLERALAVFQKAFPDGHLFVAAVQRDLGRAATQRGDLAEAERILQEAIDLQDALVGSEHPERVLTTYRLAAVRLEQGKLAEGRELLEQVIAIREKKPKEYGALIALNYIRLAGVDVQLKDYARARAELDKAETLARDQGWHDVDGRAAFGRAKLARAQGDRGAAKEAAHRALAIFEEADGDFSEDLAEVRAWLKAERLN